MKWKAGQFFRVFYPPDLSPVITLSVLFFAITQTALQASLYTVEDKSYNDFEGTCVVRGFSLPEMISRGRQENICLIILHIWSLVVVLTTLLRPSVIQIPFLFVMLGLSVASGLAQYLQTTRLLSLCPPCDSTSCHMDQRLWLHTARLILSIVFLCYSLILLWKFQRKALVNGTLWKASASSILLVGIGMLILSLDAESSGPTRARRNFSAWPFFYVFVAFSIIIILVSMTLAFMRRSVALSAESITQQELPLPTSRRRSKSLPRIHDEDIELAEKQSVIRDTPDRDEPSRFKSVDSTRESSTIQEIDSPFPASKRSSQIPSVRSSIASKSFHTAANSYTSSIDGEEPRPDEDDSIPFPSADTRSSRIDASSLRVEIPGIRQPSNDTPSMVTPTSPPEPDLPTPPASASVPAQASVPAYSRRDRRDTLGTLGSDRTYETLPSYHSRRSTQTLPDTIGTPITPRFVRSLPPLPPLPPFISMVSLLPSHLTDPTASSPREADDDVTRDSTHST
ncbi:hypothetical protein Moror_10262 [Moniliophthora roreri MCA 2997]|uniref:Uncharacterized protein n=2 Tax=Moniliophthora roreri TaxID=221103 RepID=V2XHU9_MONRO|nr:hypothetical protein Moror_10262 [Moniliophthora roreri MCA 2997]KAI3604435.1 hypothetical protein WG66_008758 [Moniliophthora roreri]